jgi:hypothetical protein
LRRLNRRSAKPAPPSVIPSSASDTGAVALDGRDVIPSKPVELPEVRAFESVDAAALCVVPPRPVPAVEPVDEFASPDAVHTLLSSVVGDGPADAFAPRHVDPEGVPAAPVPSDPFVAKSSDALDGSVPQVVPRLASVGTPGDASAVEQVEAMVGSSAEPTPASEPANEPVTVATAFALTSESDVETLVWLASASAEGPDVVAAGTDPSGADGSGSDADPVTGTVADVPGPVAEVEPCVGELGPVELELVAVIGSLEATVAGPALPPLAEEDPPTVELCVSGRTSG